MGRLQFLSLLLALKVIHVGIWFIPNLASTREIALDPFRNPFGNPEADYLLHTWLSPMLSWLIGANTFTEVLLLHLCITGLFLIVVTLTLFEILPEPQARVALIIFWSAPVSGVSLYWIGPDSLTLFLLASACVLNRRPPVVFVLGLLLGLQHFEQAVFGAISLVPLVMFPSRDRWVPNVAKSFVPVLFTGLVLGKIALLAIFSTFPEDVNSGRPYWLITNFASLTADFVSLPLITLWSGLGMCWIALAKFAQEVRCNARLLIALAIPCSVLPVVADPTRVLAITSFPLLYFTLLTSQKHLTRWDRPQAARWMVTAVVIPWLWVWGGTVHTSTFFYGAVWLLNRTSGLFELPNDLALWPFR